MAHIFLGIFDLFMSMILAWMHSAWCVIFGLLALFFLFMGMVEEMKK